MNPVDKRRVRAAFSRSAARYDARAEVQARVRERVLAQVAAAAPSARRVLDVGSGTGALLAALAAARPALEATAVDLAPAMCAATRAAVPRARVAVADAEALPFGDAAFDLVVSTSTLQWLPQLPPALAELRRVLAPGGVACLALFGERTLHELRAAWREAAGPAAADRTHRFTSRDALSRALAEAGLAAEAIDEEELVERHPDARAVLRALKAIGASSAVPRPRGPSGLGGRAEALELLRRYDAAHPGPGGVPATYHALYALARVPAAGPRAHRARAMLRLRLGELLDASAAGDGPPAAPRGQGARCADAPAGAGGGSGASSRPTSQPAPAPSASATAPASSAARKPEEDRAAGAAGAATAGGGAGTTTVSACSGSGATGAGAARGAGAEGSGGGAPGGSAPASSTTATS